MRHRRSNALTVKGWTMSTVTKKELAYRIATKTKIKKAYVKTVMQAFIDEIIDEIAASNRLEFREFGVFEVKMRAARKARNPRTGVRVDVPAKSVVHFKAGRMMKDRLSAAEAKRRGGGGGASNERIPASQLEGADASAE